MSLATPSKIRELQSKLYRKAKTEPGYRFYMRPGIRHGSAPIQGTENVFVTRWSGFGDASQGRVNSLVFGIPPRGLPP
jgi:hypothetical protein